LNAKFLKQPKQFEDDYDNNNYSDYVEDASVHVFTDIRLVSGGQHLCKLRQYSQRLQSVSLKTDPASHGRVRQKITA
jgi:hypothetical protein